jgi:ribosomal protein L11 methyltransferase
MNYIEWTIPLADKTVAEILIAELSEAGFEGFEEATAGILKAYAPEGAITPEAAEIVAGKGLQKEERLLPPQNWNAEWESSFEPVELEGFCRIRAHFHAPSALPGLSVTEAFEHEIVITPKMSFGTGHHATTRMMLGAMRSTPLAGKRVLDFGAGTGVLAILAAQRGAATILAVENDPGAVENCEENVAANDCRQIVVKCGSLEAAGTNSFDVILANINRNILLQYLPQMSELLASGGHLLMSGILEEDVPTLKEAAQKVQLPLSDHWNEGNWACLRFKKD